MAKKDLQDPSSFLSDLLGEVSPWFALGVVLGLVGGIAAGVWMTIALSGDSLGVRGARVLVLPWLGLLLAGLFAGLLLGVLFDSLAGLILGKRDDPPRRRRRR